MRTLNNGINAIGMTLGAAVLSYIVAVFAAQCFMTFIQWRITAPFFEFIALIAMVHFPLFIVFFFTTTYLFAQRSIWVVSGLNVLGALGYTTLNCGRFVRHQHKIKVSRAA